MGFCTIIGDWGLGIGDWGLGPIPNPQSPIPNPHMTFYLKKNLFYYKIHLLLVFKKTNKIYYINGEVYNSNYSPVKQNNFSSNFSLYWFSWNSLYKFENYAMV